ncbi:MAG: NAD(P)H-hydrate dehydratase [Ruminococcus sp.]|nr:NAD(P)H-hydrate dehydratase [Ruminococcus sp.]
MYLSIDKNIVKSTIKKHPPESDKTTVGALLSICGSYGMAGAAIMSSKAALRSGIGLLKIATAKSVYPIIAGAVPEAVFYPLEDNYISDFDFIDKSRYCSAILAGPGLSVNNATRELVYDIVLKSDIPLILDADALNILSSDTDILRESKAPIILTPHDREFARLIGCYPENLSGRRGELAVKFAERYDVIVVLKGYKTIVASPSGDVFYNEELGNAGMATGGSGDVLSGMTASFVAQGFDIFKSAASAVYMHALAGDIAKEKLGEFSMLPTDIIDCIPEAFKRLGYK